MKNVIQRTALGGKQKKEGILKGTQTHCMQEPGKKKKGFSKKEMYMLAKLAFKLLMQFFVYLYMQ